MATRLVDTPDSSDTQTSTLDGRAGVLLVEVKELDDDHNVPLTTDMIRRWIQSGLDPAKKNAVGKKEVTFNGEKFTDDGENIAHATRGAYPNRPTYDAA